MTNAIVPYMPLRNTIYNWDALQLAQHMPTESVNCIISSPPYWSLRDYSAEGQYGLEETPDQYVTRLVRLFRELRRVLRNDGTLWLNLGDTYAAGGRGSSDHHRQKIGAATAAAQALGRKDAPQGMKQKDLVGIPWMVAFALRADGWYLRSDIIWSKPNPMPESVEDRCTKSHEYIFMLAKSERYFYDADAIRESHAESSLPRALRGVSAKNKYANGAPGSTAHAMSQPRENVRKMTGTGYSGDGTGLQGHSGYYRPDGTLAVNPMGRNKRTVWEVSTKPFHAAHFATFPEDLIEPMILAGCPKTCCAVCGAPHVRVVEIERSARSSGGASPKRASINEGGVATSGLVNNTLPLRSTLGFTPTCRCNGDTRPGLTYDPFMGAGTTALVAHKLGRDYLGSELNPEYVELARARVEGRLKEYLAMKEGKPYMESLFTA